LTQREIDTGILFQACFLLDLPALPMPTPSALVES
jgi:hypothetical protein